MAFKGQFPIRTRLVTDNSMLEQMSRRSRLGSVVKDECYIRS
jgi:hypothetical protein